MDHLLTSTLTKNLLIGFIQLSSILAVPAYAAPSIGGNASVVSSSAGTVVVIPEKINLRLSSNLCIINCRPVGIGIDLNLSRIFPPANVSSVVLMGNARVSGDITVNAQHNGLMILSSGSNVNSINAK